MVELHYRRSRQGFQERLVDWTSQVTSSKVFWAVLILKLVSMALFASHYLLDLFIPFLERFAAEPFQNPYQYFWQADASANFPYPALMLFVMGLPRALLVSAGLENLPQGVLIFFYRLPLLAADIAIFLVLCRWMRQRIDQLLWLYWSSPVLFYISYVHGQLDAIPVAILLLSIYFLFSGRELLAAILLGCALAAKTHIVVVLPFALVYLWQRTGSAQTLLRFLGLSSLSFILLNAPYIASDGFLNMVFLNAEQNKLMLARLPVLNQNLQFYIIPSILVILIAYSLHIRIQNREIFLTFVAFAFGVILLFIPPSQGWYFWIIPFFVYFFAKAKPQYIILFGILQAAYLLYFALIPVSDYSTVWLSLSGAEPGYLYRSLQSLGISPDFALNLSFTALQTALLLCCTVMYYRGIYLPQRNKLTATPYLVGVSGDSGAGKSTLSAGLQQLFGERVIDVFCGDDMHKWQRGHDRWSELTHLDPRANNLHSELRYLTLLKQNRPIWRRHYDHTSGQFTQEVLIKPRPIMVLEGLHAFYLKSARELIDLKVFVKPDAELLLHRKVLRDMKKRNYTREQVLQSVERRQEDSRKFIDTQESHADIVVSLMSEERINEIGSPEVAIKEWLRVTLTNVFFLDPLIDDIVEITGHGLRHYYDHSDRQVIEFTEQIDREQLVALGEKHLGGLQNLGIYNPLWLEGWQGVVQLLIGYCILHGWEDRDNA